MRQHFAQPPLPRSIPWLSTVHLFGVAVPIGYRLTDKLINNVLRIVTECLRPTPTDNLFIFSDIKPTELCRQKAVVLPLIRRT